MKKQRNSLNIAKEVMKELNEIEYGFPDEKGNNILTTDENKWDNEFYNFYYLQSPHELLKSKIGVCWEQVELERHLFSKEKIKTSTYFICSYNGNELPSHTILVFKQNKNYYWFEHSWGSYRGIHKYNSIKELLNDVVSKFKSDNKINNNVETKVYKYTTPLVHITCENFYKFVEKFKVIMKN